MSTTFKTGDIVEFGGLRGRVVDGLASETYPITVRFHNAVDEHFTIDGKYWTDHAEPLLKLIERPKKLKKYEVYRAVHSGPDGFYTTSRLYMNKEDALGECYYPFGHEYKKKASGFETVFVEIEEE